MANQYPKIEFRNTDPLQDYFVDSDGSRYSVAKLVDDTKCLKSFDMPLAGLNISDKIWNNLTIYELSFHVKRVNEANLDYPIILTWDGAIADGRHRIIKALMLGEKTIKAVRMNWKPTPCKEAA